LMKLTCNIMRSSDNVEAFIIVIISRLNIYTAHFAVRSISETKCAFLICLFLVVLLAC